MLREFDLDKIGFPQFRANCERLSVGPKLLKEEDHLIYTKTKNTETYKDLKQFIHEAEDGPQFIRCLWAPQGSYSMGRARKLTLYERDNYFSELMDMESGLDKFVLQLRKPDFEYDGRGPGLDWFEVQNENGVLVLRFIRLSDHNFKFYKIKGISRPTTRQLLAVYTEEVPVPQL